MRSLACLTISFLETASNPTFRNSLFHEILYRYHLLGETSLPDPGLTPYYDQQLYATIKHYNEHSPLNVAVTSIRQWYTALMEDKVPMTPLNEDSPQSLIPVRAESLSPSSTPGDYQDYMGWKVIYLPFFSNS
jgi:hypothetical protein